MQSLEQVEQVGTAAPLCVPCNVCSQTLRLVRSLLGNISTTHCSAHLGLINAKCGIILTTGTGRHCRSLRVCLRLPHVHLHVLARRSPICICILSNQILGMRLGNAYTCDLSTLKKCKHSNLPSHLCYQFGSSWNTNSISFGTKTGRMNGY